MKVWKKIDIMKNFFIALCIGIYNEILNTDKKDILILKHNM